MNYAPLKALILLPALCFAPAAFAHPVETAPADTPAKVPAQIKPLTKADIETMTAQMPDFNKIMSGMQTLMKDPKTRAGLESAAAAAGKTFDGMDMSAKTKDGMPDMNAMMGSMLSLLGDEEMMRGLTETLSAVAGPMEAIVKDAVPAAPLVPEAPAPKP